MRSYYFPGSRGKPVVMIFGGYDSTNEESFFWLGYPLIRRNYPVILFEGPGQSDMIRRYGIRFTPDWHRPVGTVIDYAESKYPELHSRKKVLVGISLGGILAGRAAALEKRIGAVMLFGSPFSFEDSARNQMPAIIRYFYDSGRAGLFNTFAGIKKRFDLKLKWGLDNGLWCIGGTTPFDFVRNGRLYTLADVESRITCPVLVFYGEKDMYVADGIQDGKFQNAFRNSKEYTIRIFRDIDGSAEHCQIGAGEQAVYYFTSWLRKIGFEK
jgi:pimeloyl-ACP methyl ester carboxylesterase